MAKSGTNFTDTVGNFTHNPTSMIEFSERISLATALLQKGARTSTVQAVTGLSKKHILQLFRDLSGISPSTGLLPRDSEWPIKSVGNNIHASLFLEIYLGILEKCQNPARKPHIFLAAYTLYEEIADPMPALNINRAWRVIQQVSIREIEIANCSRCRVSYIASTEFPREYRICPHCDAQSPHVLSPKTSANPLWLSLRVAGLSGIPSLGFAM